MARATPVNLDAMIKREDFAASDYSDVSFENVSTISLRDFTEGALIGPNLRKPDFQRETNHWSPSQVVSFLECFINGDLIPSVILWKSPTFLFVIDGGHRLSALKAWIEDDYGDGPISQTYFGYAIPEEQRRVAEKVRALVNKKIGRWEHLRKQLNEEDLDPVQRRKLGALVTRGLQIQWVNGDADKAESSFFMINTKGTPLDDIEEVLLKNRKKPVSITARAIIRAGKGHRYWSSFDKSVATEIERLAGELHVLLFDPEVRQPIKTLDLPLGGPKAVRLALESLIEMGLIAVRKQDGSPKRVEDTDNDVDGSQTIRVLNRLLRLVKRVTGNDSGSLGLHPAVFFYGPTGRHSGPMFMGTMALIAKKLESNDKSFFNRFTTARSRLEEGLIINKELIALIVQKPISTKRAEMYARFLDELISHILEGNEITESSLVKLSGLEGKLFVGGDETTKRNFSDDVKSGAFISTALASAVKCPICSGYIDPVKSVSYDHVQRVREGGKGTGPNCQLTHPFCNQSVKQ